MSPDAPAVKPRVVLATENRHKLREITAMLQDAPFELVGLGEYPGVILPPETADTFEGNAIGKAAAVAEQTGVLAIGDDSGLQVDALGGAPGVWSARFAGPGATDSDNVRLLLDRMENISDHDRRARFVCALAIAYPSGKVETVLGTCEGQIVRSPRGENGFGYDPVFLIPGDGRTLAEFHPDEKNSISHRARALAAARPVIEAALDSGL